MKMKKELFSVRRLFISGCLSPGVKCYSQRTVLPF